MPTSRRTVVKLALSQLALAACSRVAPPSAAQRRPLAATPPPLASAGTSPHAPRVAGSKVQAVVVRSEQHLDALEKALEACGGLGFVRRGDTVVLKVNTNSGDPFPYSTSPDVVRYLGRRLRDAGARVIVGDRSFWGDDDTAGNFVRNGMAAAAREAEARLEVWGDEAAWVAIDPALVPTWKGPVRLPRSLIEAHHVINLPCLKTHFITGCTLSLKNALGVVHPVDRARPGNLRSHEQQLIYRQVAEINRAYAPTLNILDGFRALVSGGPTPHSGSGPTIVKAGTIIVSADRVATDAVGIALLQGMSPETETVTRSAAWSSPTILAAAAAGVGIANADELSIHALGIEDAAALEARARAS